MEHFQEDLAFIEQLAGFKFKKSKNIIKNQSKSGRADEQTLQYFKMLDKKVLKEVYKLYEVDFELFGYSADLYF